METWGGIECSLNRIGNVYQDQLAYIDHYNRIDDLKHICDLGIKTIRYPILWEKNWPDKNVEPVWEVAAHLAYLKVQNINVIAGLVHHGSGPDYASIQSTDFASQLAFYAQKVALQFPWINDYTPINEPLTTARFCGLYGHWYPHQRNCKSFLQILINECKATILAMQAIKLVNPAARLIFTEDLTQIHGTPLLREQVNFENERRWLSIDLLCGLVKPGHALWNYVLDSGILESELDFFINNPYPPDVLGFNYYITSERFLDEELSLYPSHYYGGNGKTQYADVEAIRSDKTEIAGPKTLLRLAWERYHLQMAITEAHLSCETDDQLCWLNWIWKIASELENEGVNMKAVTFWSLFGAHGWDQLLTAGKGKYEPGAFDCSLGTPNATALVALIKNFGQQNTNENDNISELGWWQKEDRFKHRSISIVQETL